MSSHLSPLTSHPAPSHTAHCIKHLELNSDLSVLVLVMVVVGGGGGGGGDSGGGSGSGGGGDEQ